MTIRISGSRTMMEKCGWLTVGLVCLTLVSTTAKRYIKFIMVLMAFAAAIPARATLVGSWNFNEGSGSTALDSSGNAFNGVINGATYVPGPAGFGTALLFNGTSDYVNVGGTGTALQLVGTQYTIAWWMKWTGNDAQAAQRIVNMEDGQDLSGGYSELLLPQTSSKAFYSVHNSGGTGSGAFSLPNYFAPVGQWAHLAVVRNGSGRQLYVNGLLYGSWATTTGNLTSDGNDPLTFGNLINPANPTGIQFFNGALDEIRIYNNALSASEVFALTVVPEPATVWLLGLGGLLLWHRWH